MKYLIIQKARWTTGYSIEEFATAEEVTAHLLSTDAIAKDVIVAQRLGLQISLGEYVAPAPVETPADIEEKVAA